MLTNLLPPRAAPLLRSAAFDVQRPNRKARTLRLAFHIRCNHVFAGEYSPVHLSDRSFTLAVSLAAFFLTVFPVNLYLLTGWKVRRDKLFSYLNPDALNVYYGQFPWTNSTQTDLSARFREQFAYLYGRRHYILPILLFTLLAGLGVCGIASTVEVWRGTTPHGFSLQSPTVFAILGGFVWCVSDELSRIVSRDLSARDVYNWSFRLLLAVPFGYALAAGTKDNFAVPVAFFMGAFPTQTLMLIARRIAVQKLSVGDQQTSAKLELEALQCIGRSNAEAFQDEGIDTISSLAWADPVDLTIRTNFDFNYVLDCMSQALLYVYFEEKTRLLFKLSLRGAQEAISLMNELEGTAVPYDEAQVLSVKQKTAKATLQAI